MLVVSLGLYFYKLYLVIKKPYCQYLLKILRNFPSQIVQILFLTDCDCKLIRIMDWLKKKAL